MATIVLDSTTKSIKAVMSGAAATTNPDFTATYSDSSGTSFVEGANDGALNGVTSVTVVDAPAASTRRVIKSITIENKDTAPVTVTLSYDNNGTLRTIARVTLSVNDTWTLDGAFDGNGNFKQTVGTVNLASQVIGVLPVANGGSGASTLSGLLKGNGTSAFTAATVGTDYVAPATATNFTATQTFTGSTSAVGAVLNDVAEIVTVSATAATGTINFDVTTQPVLFYTTNASGNFTVNFRASGGNSLNNLMSTGQSLTVAFLVTNGGTAYYNTVVQVDGTTSGVTTRWQGGTAPSSGNASSVDVYTYTIIKTASATFSVFASQTRFA